MELYSMAEASGAPYELRMEVERLTSTYRMLVEYALNGTPDPTRDEMLERIDADVRRICGYIIREKEAELSPDLYFSTLRYVRNRHDESIPTLVAEYMKRNAENALKIFSPSGIDAKSRRELEAISTDLFNRIWVTSPLSKPDAESILAFLRDETVPVYAKAQCVSAVTMNLMQCFDERGVRLIADAYTDGGAVVDVRALCGLLLVLWRWRDIPLSSSLQARLDALAELDSWRRDVRTAFMQFIKARDTERVTRTMNEEVIPRMMKLRTDLGKLGDIENPEDFAMLEENPEWEELMRKSGVENELKKLTEMQSEGADVLMSTFSHLKTFPFFNDMANWFLPFYTDVTALDGISGHGALDYLSLVSSSPLLCDGDKYSMALSLNRVPESQRNMLLGQLAGHAKDFESMAEDQTADKRRERGIDCYVKDLYRFFNLFRRKGEFYNPFTAPINLVELDICSEALSGFDMLSTVAEFYFRHEYYQEALNIYRRLIDENPLDESIYQKAGYCLQKLGDIAGALDMYRRAELINPSSTWLLRRLAACCKMTGNTEEALRYYLQLADKFPDDMKVTLSIGHCLMELGRYAEALNQYYKVEYTDGISPRTVRPIAWCLFLSGDLNKAAAYYSKLAPEVFTTADYVNQGHLYMAMSRYRDAVTSYTRALEGMKRDMDRLTRTIDADKPYLEAAGVDMTMKDIVLDTVNRTLWP
ncbi:MAG: tetratricopeptide repeat protein [Muribaculaceae bacterium]|nr:tetratricopeptide repeat protein [Muribaculaceae bacterium]